MTVSEPSGSERSERTLPDLIDGLESGVTTAGGGRERFGVEAPARGEVVGDLPACTPADVETAFERAAAAGDAWSDRSPAERAEVFVRYHDRLFEHREELLDVIQLETGKARRHAHAELLDVAMTARYYAYRTASFLESERRRGALPGLTATEVHRHPVGTVGVISPWNYPLTLSISDIVPALLAGNAVVLKPSEETSYTALKAAELLYGAGLPRELLHVVTGFGPELGESLVAASDYVCFTGSTETGRIVARTAGETLTDCSLELGGKNPAIVRPDADVERAAEGLVRGCFANAGQLCLSIERIYVHESIRARFLDAFVDATESMRLGVGPAFDVEMGSLSSGSHLSKVERHVEEAKREGATAVTGGRTRPDIGPYVYEPTVLTGVDESATLHDEETFGPVVSVYGYTDDDEAVRRANDTEYGLNASIWTDDAERGRELAARIEVGTVNINESYAAAWASMDAPMGGVGDSGIGRRHGEEGLLRFTESQTVATQRGPQFAAPKGIPYRLYAKLLDATTALQRRVPGLR